MRFSLQFFLFLLLIIPSASSLFGQSLIINEVSQGPSGSKEYVELLVIPGNNPNPCGTACLDLKNWIIDDNNGYFSNGPSSGEGVADGCIRFANNGFWDCIPVGTLIVIYNDADLNISVPAQDISMQDNNCRLIIPISSTLFEKHSTNPSVANGAVYPISGYTTGGNWSNIGMANTDDSFQIYSAGNYNIPVHSVSWGNNNANNLIYFPGPATNSVYSFTNNTSSNPNLQANWTSGTCNAPNNQTPGVGNNVQNTAYIASLTNNCTVVVPILANLSIPNQANCTCNGSASSTPSGGSGYTYVWMDNSQVPLGQNSATATNLCAGWYYCQVTSANGCIVLDSIEVTNSNPVIEPTFNPIGAICQNAVAPQLPLVSTNGITGTWNPAVIQTNNLGMSSYVFTPNVGPCSDTTVVWVSITNGTTAIFSIVDTICVFSNPNPLPLVSNNGIIGTWNPSSVNTNLSGQTNCVFTPQSGQCANPTNVNIIVLDSVAPAFFYFGTYCINEVPLSLQPQSQNGINGTWVPPVITTTVQGVSFYTFTPAPGYNCVASLTINTVISDSIVPMFNQVGPYCVGQTVPPLPVLSLDGITGTWYPSPVNTSTAGSFTYIFTSIPMACTTIETMTIDVQILDVNAGNDTTVCIGTVLSLQGSGANTYSWSNGIQNNVPFTVNGTVNYILTGNTGTCVDTDTVLVSALLTPTASIICSVDSTIGFFENNSTNGSNYSWDFGDATGLNTNLLGDTLNDYSVPGNYQIQLIVFNNNGCSDTTYCNITIDPIIPPQPETPLIVEIPNMFSPNDDVSNEQYGLMLSGEASFTALILNRWGEQVAELNDSNPTWNGKFDNKDCTSGVYFVVYEVIGINQEIRKGHTFLHLIR